MRNSRKLKNAASSSLLTGSMLAMDIMSPRASATRPAGPRPGLNSFSIAFVTSIPDAITAQQPARSQEQLLIRMAERALGRARLPKPETGLAVPKCFGM